MSELHGTVTRNLRVLMAIRGIDQRDIRNKLAAILDVDPSNISQKMRGRRQWSLDDIDKLAAEFSVPAGALLGEVAALVDPANGPTAVGGAQHQGQSSTCDSVRYLPARSASSRVTTGSVNLNQLADVIPIARRRSHATYPTRPGKTVQLPPTADMI